MKDLILGLHHITAITGDAQKNIDFYTKVLGLKFVKLSVNQDDPSTYHLYFGDRIGSPGTVLTFFAWQGGRGGQKGVNQAMTVSFSLPESSLAFWIDRLISFSVPFETNTGAKFDDNSISFRDPDGILIELVANNQASNPKKFAGYGVPGKHAIRGFFGATLLEDGFEETDKFLRDVMGFKLIKQDGNNTFRYGVDGLDQGIGKFLDVRSVPDFLQGEMGTGIIHHVAFRVADDQAQEIWHKKLSDLGYNVSPIIDRTYFHSIYFHEPGGVLFEIATEGPGFMVDEPEDRLGTSLKLTPRYEPHREELERILPKIILPSNE